MKLDGGLNMYQFTFNDFLEKDAERNKGKKKNKRRLISLFSGCGGMDIGFEGGFTCSKRSINKEFIRIGLLRMKECGWKLRKPDFKQCLPMIYDQMRKLHGPHILEKEVEM